MVEIFGNSAERAVRTGIVEGLPTTGNPEDVLWAAMTAAGMPAAGSLYPGRTNCFLRTTQVFGLSHDMARVKLIYEPFEGTNTSVIIRVGASLSTYQTNKLPGTQQPIAVEWVPTDTTKYKPIPLDYVPIVAMRPMRRVSVTQLRAGILDVAEAASFAEYVGMVNSTTWFGKGPGSYIISGADATISKYSGYYQRTVEAMNQGLDKWSHYGVLRSAQTGKFAGGAIGGTDDINTQLSTLVAMSYMPKSIRYPASSTKGVVRVDPYDWTDFTPIFGF